MTLKPSILFLADTTHPAQAVHDHIAAATSSSELSWQIVNPLLVKVLDKLNLSDFDAIGVHYSVKIYDHYYLSKTFKKRLAHYSGIKFVFLQDEYQHVNQTQQILAEIGFHVLFTLVNSHSLATAYPDLRLKSLVKVPVLTAYVSEDMKTYTSLLIRDRKIDVSYRARRCPYSLGRLAYEKQWIADEFIRRTQGKEFKLDISLEENERLYGQAWLALLGNSKAVLGTESGSSIWDFDRGVERKTHQFLKKNRHASFETVYNAVLKEYDGNVVYSAISPRLFEAAAMKTVMILFPGYYSGVCQADKHYLALEKDFSNFDDVLAKLKDDDFMQALVDRAYDDLILSGRYSQQVFAQKIATTLLNLIPKHDNTALVTSHQVIEKTCKQYRKLNWFRLIKTEVLFMLRNFIQFVFDDKYDVHERVHILGKGLRRYMTYFLPRIKAVFK